MPVGEVVFVLDWASECQCDWGPDVSGHLQLSIESLIESGKPAHDVVVHLEAVKKRADEVAELLGLDYAPDDLLAYEVMTTIIHESIHCAIADALTSGEGVESLLIARLWRGYFEELVVEALSHWSILGVFARAPALFHANLKTAGSERAQIELIREGVEFMDKMSEILEEGVSYPDFLRRYLSL